MCLSCHLPMRDVLQNQSLVGRSALGSLARSLRMRIVGLVFYAAVVTWCWYRLPTSLSFVVPGAVVGSVLHIWKGWPWLGLVAFFVVVAVVPAVFWPSMLTGAFSNLTDGR